jgi:hypothetical protein
MLGRTCFIASLPFGVVTNSQIAFWASGDASYEVIIPFMGSMVTTFLASELLMEVCRDGG